MSKTGTFTLQGPHEGKTMVILEKYPFIDGVFKTNSVSAQLMRRILCEFYGCKLVIEEGVITNDGDELNDDGSLAVSSTRGMTVGDKMENHDLHQKLIHAEDVRVKGLALEAERALEAASVEKPVVEEKVVAPAKAKIADKA